MKFSILSKAREQAKQYISNQSKSMRGKSKSKSSHFKVGDGRRRGSPHEGWEKRQGGSMYIRGQTTTDISKTGECILRDNILHTEPKQTIMQLRTKTPCTICLSPALLPRLKERHIDCFMLEKHVTCSMQHTICTSCRAQTAQQTYSLTSKGKNRRASAGKRR